MHPCTSDLVSGFQEKKTLVIVRCILDLVIGFQEESMYITTGMYADQFLIIAEY
jgi:hypothetical protein